MVKVANPLYTDWILEAIQKVKRQKQRPSEERICNAVASAHGLDRQTVLEQLELSVRDGSVLLVCSKGLSSYRDPAAAAAPSWSGLDWQALIRRALEVLQEAGGSPLKSLEHWVQQQPEVVALLGPAGAQGPSRLHQQLRLALKRAVTQGRVVKQGRLYQVGGAAGPLASLPPVRLLPHEKDKPVAEPIPICSFCLGTEEQNRERKPEELISCADCGNSGHPSCLKFSPELTLRVKALWWQCIECKTCSFCQDQGKNADNMLFCDSCDRGFHMECCDPPLTRMPKGMWICQVCQPRNQEGRKLLHDTAAQIKRRYGGPLGRPKGRSHQSFRKLHGPGRPGRPRGPGRPSWRSSSGRGRGRPPRVTRSPFPFTEGYPGDDLQLFAPKDEDYSNNGKPANLSLYMSSSPELCEEEEEDDACLGLTKVEGHKQQELGEGSAGSPHGSVEQQENEVLRLEECDLELFRHVQEMALRKVGVASGRISSRPRRPPVVEFGNFEIQAWYSSPYPQGYSRLPKLYLCEFCLHYMRSRSILFQHRRRCHWYHPPADEIYRKDNLSVFEVDGSVSTSYCQNLCLLAKFFLDHKTLYQDVEPFLFYVLTQNDGKGCHLVGYFSKEKHCLQRCNVSCIMILPQYQRKGYGRFLIDFSYLLSKREGRPGSPEKPLSDLGRLSYTAYWRSTLMEYLHTVGRRKQLCICQLSQATGICPQDVSSTLRDIGMLRRCGDSLLLVRRESLISAHMARLRARPRLLEVDPHCLRWSPGPCSNGVVSDGEEEDEEERKGEKLFERVPGETRKHLPESPPHRSQSSPLPSPPSPAHSPGLPSLPRSTSVKNRLWGKVKDRPRGQRGRPRKNPRPEDKEPVAGEEDELPVQEASVEKMPRLQPTPAPRSRGRPPHRKRGPKPKPVELSPADTPVPSDVPPPGEQEEEEEEEEDDEEEEEMEEEPNSPSPSVPTLKSKKPLRRRRGRQRSFPPSSVVTETISETTQVLDGPLADSDPENSTPACAAPVPPTPGRQPALTDSEEEEEDEVVEDDEGEEGSMQGLTTVPVEPPATPHAKRRGWSKGECFMPASPPIPEGAETQPQRRGVEVEEEEEQEEEDVQQLTTHNAEELDKEEPEQDAGQTLPPSPASAFDGEEASTGSGGGLATQEKWEVPDNHVGMASEEKWEGPENQVRVANPEKWEGTVSGGPTHILDGPMNEDGPVNEKAGQWEWKDKEEVGPLQEEGLADDQAERQRREREAAAVEALSILPASPEQPPPPPAGTKPDLELETVQVGQSLSEARDAAAAYQDCEETVAACRALQSFSQAEEEEEEEQRGGPAVALVEEEEDQEQEEEESGPAPGPAPTPTAYPEASPATGVVDSGFSDLGSIESTSESYDTHSGYEAGLLPTPLLDRAPPTSVAPAFTTPASSCSSSSFPTSSAPPPPLQPSRPPQKKKQQQPAPRPPSQCSMASCYASTPMVMEVPESGLYEGSYPQPSATFSLAKLQQLTNTIMDPHMLYTCAPAAQAPPTVPPGPLLACTVPSGPTSRRSQGQTALSKGPVAIRSKPPPPQQPPQLFSSARTLVPNLVPAPVTYYSGPRPVANGSYHGNPSYVSPPAQYPVQVGVMGGQAYPQQPGSHGNVMYTGPSHHGYINAGVPKQSPYMSR